MKNAFFRLIVVVVFFCVTSCGQRSSRPQSSPDYYWEPTIVTVEDEEPEEQWEDCEKCGGDGRLSRYCSTCDGSGRLIERTTRTQTRSCKSCFGLGIAPCNSCGNMGYHHCSHCELGYKQCPTCGGAGVIYSYGAFYKCHNCSGSKHSGYVMCTICYGDGKITCDVCQGRGKLDCPTCHGTGGPTITHTETNDIGECPSCYGSGRVYDECFMCEGEGKIKIE